MSAGAMGVSTWSGVGQTAGPAIVERWTILYTAEPRPEVGICCSATTVGRSTISTTPVAPAAARNATTKTPRPGWKNGGRNSCQSRTFMSSLPCRKSCGRSYAVTNKTGTIFCSAPRHKRS
jgi:hypothetical protein